MLDQPPWRAVQGCFDLRLYLELPPAVLEARLMAHWRGYGLDDCAARQKLDQNDLPNARRGHQHGHAADLVVRN